MYQVKLDFDVETREEAEKFLRLALDACPEAVESEVSKLETVKRMTEETETSGKSIDELRKFFEDVLPAIDGRGMPSIPGSDEYVPSSVSNGTNLKKPNGRPESDSNRNQ